MFFQQMTGVNAIITNLTDLFRQAHVPAQIAKYASPIAGSAQVIACVCAGPLVQMLGRKAVWIVSLAGITLTDVLYALYQNQSVGGRFPNWLPIVVVFAHLFAFGLGIGPIPWFFIPEMFPADIRPMANSIATSSNWMFAFLVIVCFPKLREAIGDWVVFVMFAAVSFGATMFGAVFVKDPDVAVLGGMSDPLLGEFPSRSVHDIN
jgi:MFS family permease